jgi:hypothetical protein
MYSTREVSRQMLAASGATGGGFDAELTFQGDFSFSLLMFKAIYWKM